MDIIRVDKLSAANRQIDTAIRMLFVEEDILAVHTLAGAASVILSDLVEAWVPEKSWDKVSQGACDLDAKTYFNIMRRTQNYLKHATNDPDAEHAFRADDTPGILMWAIMNLAELQSLTSAQQVFQLWFLACNLDLLSSEAAIKPLLKELFGDLSRRSMTYRLAVGRRVLREYPNL